MRLEAASSYTRLPVVARVHCAGNACLFLADGNGDFTKVGGPNQTVSGCSIAVPAKTPAQQQPAAYLLRPIRGDTKPLSNYKPQAL